MAIAPVDKYYLVVEDLDGGVTAGRPGAFAVAHFRFDLSALVAGVPVNPAPLAIDLEPGANLTAFLDRMARAQSFAHVRLEGVTSEETGAHTVYDLRLQNAYVARITDTGGHDHLQLSYSAVSLTTRQQVSAAGSLGAPETIAWDVNLGTTSTRALPAADPGTPRGAGNLGARYFLTVDGLDGGATAKGVERSFAVENFRFDIADATNIVTPQNPRPGPLVVELAAGASLAGLLSSIAQAGKTVVRLQGVVPSPDGQRLDTIYDLRLAGAELSKVADTNGVDHLEFAYRAVTLTTANGPVGLRQTAGWDINFQTPLGGPLAAAVAGSFGGSVAGPLTYYLTVGGLDGEVTTPGHVGAFAVTHFSFEASRSAAARAGRAVPEPLVVDLARDADLTGFLGALTGKSPGRLVRLAGVTDSPGGELIVYDLRLSGAFVSRVIDTRGVDRVELAYTMVSLTTSELDADGSLGPSATTAWDTVSHTVSTLPLAIANAGMTLTGGAADDTLTGGVANDSLDGKAGADRMSGGGGNDSYVVDNAADQVIERAGGGTDTVWAVVSYALPDGQEVEFLRAHAGPKGLTLTGNGFHNEVIGGVGDDTLFGAGGEDRLVGHDGEDLLNGGAAADVLSGGDGSDVFAWSLATEGGDTVADFHSGSDRLQFDAAAFGLGALTASNFVAGDHPQAQGNGPTFLMNTSNHNLYFDSDGTGSAAPALIAHLHTNAVASDFQFV